jgi:uncharacterized protein YjgD (DUF1641 family)
LNKDQPQSKSCTGLGLTDMLISSKSEITKKLKSMDYEALTDLVIYLDQECSDMINRADSERYAKTVQALLANRKIIEKVAHEKIKEFWK